MVWGVLLEKSLKILHLRKAKYASLASNRDWLRNICPFAWCNKLRASLQNLVVILHPLEFDDMSLKPYCAFQYISCLNNSIPVS